MSCITIAWPLWRRSWYQLIALAPLDRTFQWRHYFSCWYLRGGMCEPRCLASGCLSVMVIEYRSAMFVVWFQFTHVQARVEFSNVYVRFLIFWQSNHNLQPVVACCRALEVFTIMRCINLHFAYLFTYLLKGYLLWRNVQYEIKFRQDKRTLATRFYSYSTSPANRACLRLIWPVFTTSSRGAKP